MVWSKFSKRVRITGGSWKSRRFKPMKSFKGRPTTDFAREGLFNLLRSRVDLDEAKVLDLFAGTGMVGIECASRGAASIVAVEKNRQASSYIKSCYKELGFESAVVLNQDAFTFLKRSAEMPSVVYDLVFADPPYKIDGMETIPSLVQKAKLVAEDGLLVLEHGAENSFEGEPGYVETRRYGHVNFSFFNFES